MSSQVYLKKMIEIDKIKKVYLLGIGGIGMSALARYFRFLGKKVEGYDRTQTPLTRDLGREGILIHFNTDLSKIPVVAEKPSTLVIYTPAIEESFPELQYFRSNNFIVLKRSQVLGIITSDKRCIAVAGTHGKTSVTTMVAHLLKQSAVDCSAFMGGISKNYGTNLLLPANKSNFIVVEADEYDRSFLQLNPEIAVITWMDADHLDIYGNHQGVIDAYNEFVSQIIQGGALIYRSGLNIDKSHNSDLRYLTYSVDGKADFTAVNIRVESGSYHFDLRTPFVEIEGLILSHPGLMNVENSVAACGIALISGVKPEEIFTALPLYKGVERRFDIRYSGQKTVYIDDYAHHPRELETTIKSVRNLYPGKKITGIFQPHLYSRTRDFAADFAASLDLLDEALLIEIYPAREQPIKGVDTGMILNKMKLKKRTRCDKSDFPAILDHYNPEILLTMGAGDIDRLADPIISWLKRKEYA
jgi:UDP-N-acetylmuramate--alanine ligase